MTQRDQLEVDVVIVGAGPAGLAAAIRLRQLVAQTGTELSVMVLEKAGEIGDHGLSGAVLDPRALDELLPDWLQSTSIESSVISDELWYLTPGGKIAAPCLPPMLDNRGKYVVSLQKLTKRLGEIAQAMGADAFASFPAQELLWEGDRAVGVRIGDKGVDRDANPKATFQPGPEVHAKAVLLAEGPRGTLTKQATEKLGLDRDRDPQTYAVGVKEIWQCKPGTVRPGSVIHTMGHPLTSEMFGGGFIYGMKDDLLDIGFVTGLDYYDPSTDPHDVLQRFKLHPAITPLLEGSKLLRYGAKAIPEGGLYAMSRMYAAGLLLAGDSAGFLNGMRLKGIHLAIKSGMLAAETAFDAIVAGRTDVQAFSVMEEKFKSSWAYEELHAARNFHAGFRGGLFAGILNVGLGMLTGGRGFGMNDHLVNEAGHQRMRKLDQQPLEEKNKRIVPDNILTFEKLTDVFYSGTKHEENQPSHLHVADTTLCAERCTVEYGNPCQYFCPAKVYEPLFEREHDGSISGRLQINFANCVHCKTCDIMDPYQIITWVPPQGGEGPVYTGM